MGITLPFTDSITCLNGKQKGHDICRGLAQNCNEKTLTSPPAKARIPLLHTHAARPTRTRSGEQGASAQGRRRAIHVLIIRQVRARVNRSLITADDAANMDAFTAGRAYSNDGH
jgi:hypothetical protein